MSVKIVSKVVALTTAAVKAASADTDRKKVTLQNDAAVDVLWGNSSTTCVMRLQPGDNVVITAFSDIWAKTASSTGNLNVAFEKEV